VLISASAERKEKKKASYRKKKENGRERVPGKKEGRKGCLLLSIHKGKKEWRTARERGKREVGEKGGEEKKKKGVDLL